MRKKVLNILGRKSGKTLMSLIRLMEEERGLMLVRDRRAKNCISDYVNRYIDDLNIKKGIIERVITPTEILPQGEIETLIIDELFFFNEEEANDIFKFIEKLNNMDVIIFSSLNTNILKEQLQTVKEMEQGLGFKVNNIRHGEYEITKTKAWGLK